MARTPKRDLEEIGARIREARQSKRMSQAELAEQSQMCLAHISTIENGKSDIRLSNFIRLIEALQVSADSILRANVPLVTSMQTQEYSDLLSDCTASEISVLLHVTKEVKASLKSHRSQE